MNNGPKIMASLLSSGIAKKFFTYLMLFSVLPLIIVGIASYKLSTGAITLQARNFAQEAIEHQRDALDLKLQRVEDLTRDISGVDDITNALSMNADSINTYTELATKARIGYILNGYLGLGGLLSIDIYTLDGVHYHVGETLMTDELREEVKARLFVEALASEEFVSWAGIENNINERSPHQKVLSAASIFTEIDRKTLEQKTIAMLVANYSIEDFNNTIKKSDDEGAAHYVILDGKGRLILHPDLSKIGQQADGYLKQILQDGTPDDATEIFGEAMVVNSAMFERNGWQIASFIPLSLLTKPAFDIGIYTLAILAFCLLVISFTAFRYSRNVVEPIRRVIESFKAFEKGTLDPSERIKVTGDDEIAELSKWYNSFLQSVREQQETQSALLESENKFKDFAEATSDWFWETDVEHKFTFVSDRFFQSIHLTRDEFYGKSRINISDNFYMVEEKIEWENHLDDLRHHRPFRLNYPIRDKSGKVIYVQSSGKPVFDENGIFKGYRGTGTDISKEVEAEKALVNMNKTLENRVLERTAAVREEKDRAERLVAAIDSLNEAVAIFDSDDCLIFYNKEFFNLNAEAPEAIVRGVSFEQYYKSILAQEILPEAIGREEEWFEGRLKQHLSPKGMFELEWAKGRWLLIHEQRLPDGGSIIMSTDITQRKQLEEQVRRSQKMDAIGQLTGGIAHDFNNILGIIQGNLELLFDDVKKKEQVGFLNSAQRGVFRGADITRKLLAFSRKDVQKMDVSQVNFLIDDLEDLISRSLTAYIRVETHLADDVWPVIIDTGDFEDAMLNLSINARDAMPNGGTLIIETANKTLDEDYAALNPEGRVGDFVMISVSDTGIGMDDETKDRIFEPFFTTKKQGKGTGLGLSMVYGFVKRSGGHLQIYSEKDKGTTFHIFLPRSEDTVSGYEAGLSAATSLPRGGETILIVDDEKELREIAARHLQNLGYNTIEAESGDKALLIINQGKDIDLMFSDVVMPGELDGYQLATKIRKSQPDLKILLTSGFTKTLSEVENGDGNYLEDLIRQLLAKPYNKKELAEAIRRQLDEIR